MPVCTLHLLRLTSTNTLPHYLTRVKTLPTAPLVISRVVRWIVRPTTICTSALLDHPWDLLIILPNPTGLPPHLLTPQLVQDTYTLTAGIPSTLINSFAAKNAALLHPDARDVPALTEATRKPRVASSAQNLELSPDLQDWIPGWEGNERAGKGAVSMLNLLAFKESMHQEYLKYGKAFAESIGKRRGGTAKVVGKVVEGPRDGAKADAEGTKEWDEIALAHYPSIRHFADMAGSEDYQAVNHRHRVPSLQDTCILMTSELDLPDVGTAGGGGGPKL